MRALILCAGHGTRLGKLTKKTPKCMLKVAGKPVLEHLVDHLNSYGITEIIVNLHHKPEKIMKYFGTRLLYFYEPKLLGEEETEKQLKKWLGDKYIVMNGDTLTDINIEQMVDISNNYRQSVSSYINQETIYTGTKVVFIGVPIRANFNCYWQDIGTPEGLKKAREHYAKKKLSHLPSLPREGQNQHSR